MEDKLGDGTIIRTYSECSCGAAQATVTAFATVGAKGGSGTNGAESV